MIRLAYDILTDIVTGGAYANLALKKRLAGADAAAARSVTALVYETLERMRYADFLIGKYAKGRVHGSIRNVLRLSITRLLFMDVPDHAACSDGAELAKSIGKASLAGFVNGVLRNVARDRAADKLPALPDEPAERLSVLYGMPRFMIREYLEDYGEAFTESLLSSRLHRLTVRAQHPFTAQELAAELEKLGVAFERGKYDENALILRGTADVTGLDLFKTGKMTVQSESAMLACRACRVRPGMTVLDACAAPGGKSAYLWSLMRGEGRIVSAELYPHRAELIKKTFARLGVTGAEVVTCDAAESDFGGGSFDAVLCDAPCSGLGGGSKPDAMLNRSGEDIAALAELQLRILLNAADRVKEGGCLVYSTCTVSRRENLENARAFLAKRPDFTAEDCSFLVPGRDPAAPDCRPFLQLFPNTDGADGFFIARFIKGKNRV
ncbi:MAG: 16S rRNA (cytosine(967)-C(5))-methyltransferase RsmB [Clostridia bacterium]|nr:16S rRNA (cytosine(967)-C(5))-methyltransferase RsmB [Clostridia bacterium]